MKLRTKLIVAFLALSVLPLAGVTLYSYRSSIRALRRAVEAEAHASTGELEQRLAAVTADLGQRIERLDSMPSDVFLARDERNEKATQSAQDAQRLLAPVAAAMGDAAGWVRSLEFEPARLPAAPDAPAAPAHADPGSLVIHLNRVLGAAGEGLMDLDTVRLVRAGQNLVVLPGRINEAGDDPEALERVLAETFVTLEELGGEKTAQAAAEIAAATAGEVRRIEIESGVRLDDVGETVRGLVEAHGLEAGAPPPPTVPPRGQAQRDAARRVAVLVEQTAARVAAVYGDGAAATAGAAPHPATEGANVGQASWSRLPRLGRDFSTPVFRDGEKIGQLKARIDSEAILRNVLELEWRSESEVPFAVAADGTIYAADPAGQATVEQLAKAGLVGGAPDPDGIAATENWVVATRQVPGTDVTFGIARPVGESMREIGRTAARNMAWGLGLVAVAMLGIVPLSGRMTRNLSELSAGAAALAGGDLEARVPVHSRDEIGDLARVFNEMGASLEAQRRQLVTQERLKKELELCRQLQDEMLPSRRRSLPLADLRAVSIPAREVGGDFFNYLELEDGSVALVMGDVSGKGVPAALLMANLQATLRARLPVSPDLAALAELLDRELDGSTPSRTYVTLFLGLLDAERRSLRYVNAGHNTQYLVRADGAIERLPSGGRPLGLFAGGDFQQREVSVAPGDVVFLYTDGLVEAENRSGELWGEERLEALLVAERGRDPDGMVAEVERVVQAHRDGVDAPDDATILALRIKPA